MYVLAFDTETTGLPDRNPNAPLTVQPHVVQLAFTLFDPDRRPIQEVSTLVQLPPDVSIPKQAQDVHGISADASRELGHLPKTALALLAFAAKRADVAVAHNAEFDLKLLRYMAMRLKADHPLNECKTILCTCDAATPIVNLPPTPAMIRAGRNTPKRAKLTECWHHFFNEELEGAHDALIDTRGCARVFYHLLDVGVINVQ